jgi:site-specific DNA-methyltransferase (adenine-specific)
MDDLCQYFTPMWVAEALVERYFPQLDRGDLVIEPSCGSGSFLKPLAPEVAAVGVEIDPVVADVARRETGRRIIVGDFRTVPLDVQPTAIIGNPPFKTKVIEGFLDRAYQLLPEGGRAGFLLPAYFLQTSARVARYADRFSIAAELIPRNIFQGLKAPLVFAMFSKDAQRVMVGMALYREAADMPGLAAEYRERLQAQNGSLWNAVCRRALERLGGEGELTAIYGEVETRRPTRTRFWREKIRQTLRRYPDAFRLTAAGRYALV